MGKTSKPLRLLVHPSLLETPEVQELVAKGHTVDSKFEACCCNGEQEGSVWAYDAILGPTAWRMTLAHVKYLPLAVTEARAHRYPKEPKS